MVDDRFVALPLRPVGGRVAEVDLADDTDPPAGGWLPLGGQLRNSVMAVAVLLRYTASCSRTRMRGSFPSASRSSVVVSGPAARTAASPAARPSSRKGTAASISWPGVS